MKPLSNFAFNFNLRHYNEVCRRTPVGYRRRRRALLGADKDEVPDDVKAKRWAGNPQRGDGCENFVKGYKAGSGVMFNDPRLNKLPSLVTNLYTGRSVNCVMMDADGRKGEQSDVNDYMWKDDNDDILNRGSYSFQSLAEHCSDPMTVSQVGTDG
jgi:hypothetical protein